MSDALRYPAAASQSVAFVTENKFYTKLLYGGESLVGENGRIVGWQVLSGYVAVKGNQFSHSGRVQDAGHAPLGGNNIFCRKGTHKTGDNLTRCA